MEVSSKANTPAASQGVYIDTDQGRRRRNCSPSVDVSYIREDASRGEYETEIESLFF